MVSLLCVVCNCAFVILVYMCLYVCLSVSIHMILLQVLLYKTLAATYSLMGFKRKAAMMIHYAALQSFKLCQNYSHPQALYQVCTSLVDVKVQYPIVVYSHTVKNAFKSQGKKFTQNLTVADTIYYVIYQCNVGIHKSTTYSYINTTYS